MRMIITKRSLLETMIVGSILSALILGGVWVTNGQQVPIPPEFITFKFVGDSYTSKEWRHQQYSRYSLTYSGSFTNMGTTTFVFTFHEVRLVGGGYVGLSATQYYVTEGDTFHAGGWRFVVSYYTSGVVSLMGGEL